MKNILVLCIIAMLITSALACGPKVMVPPSIDLKQYEIMGIIEFSCSSEGKLGPLATKKFSEVARQDQGMVRIVGLGSEAEVLKKISLSSLDQAAYKALGEKEDIKTIIIGELIVSDVRPNIVITPGLDFLSFSAVVDATLTVQMIETLSGASIWSHSASDTKKVRDISIFGGKTFVFNADDPEKAYGKLVNSLVNEVTEDFRVTWVRK